MTRGSHTLQDWIGTGTLLLAVATAFAVEDIRPGKIEDGQMQRLVTALDDGRLHRTLGEVAALGARSIGMPGLDQAGDWLAERVTAIGFRLLGWQTVPVDMPMDVGSRILWRAEGGASNSAPVFALWPNLVVPPCLPGGGFGARVVDARSGRLTDMDGKDVRGAIVLMEYDSSSRWIQAASLGAGAVVFLPDARAPMAENLAKYSSVPLYCPRFYLDDEVAAAALRRLAAEGGDARLEGGMEWHRVKARNLIALLPATDPGPDPETVLLTVPFDDASVVPAFASGGQSAANVAGTLAALELLVDAQADLRRSHHLLVLFDGAHAMANAGTRVFASVLRDANAARAAQPMPEDDVNAARVRRLRLRLNQSEPWMDARRRVLEIKIGRLQAAIAWLGTTSPVRGDPFLYRDPFRMAPSPQLQHGEASQWLNEDLKDQVKRRQIAVLMEIQALERQAQVNSWTPDDAVPGPLLALRRKATYYRAVDASSSPEAILRAMGSSSAGGVEWSAEDITPSRLCEGYGSDLAALRDELRMLDQDLSLRAAIAPLAIERHIAIDLSVGSPTLTLDRSRNLGGDRGNAAMEWAWTIGPLASQAMERRVESANRRMGGMPPAFDFIDSLTFNAARLRQASPSEGYETGVDLAMAGLSPCRLCTANDPRMERMGPGDRTTRSESDLANLRVQAQTLALLLAGILDEPAMIPAAEQIRASVAEVGGKVVVRDPRAGPFPRLPVPGAIVVLPGGGGDSKGVFATRFAIAGRHGDFRFDAVPAGMGIDLEADASDVSATRLLAFHVSRKTGMLDFAPDMGASSLMGGSASVDLSRSVVYRRLVCFKGAAIQLYELADPMLLAPPGRLRILDGNQGSLENWYLSAPDANAVVGLVPENSRIKLLTSVDGYGMRMFLLGDQGTTFAGTGYEVGLGTNFTTTAMAAATDLSRLNGGRLERLESKGVRNLVASRLHTEAVERLAAMRSAWESKSWSMANHWAREAWGRDLRAYPRILDMTNQAVLAVVILLGFLGLAAVFMERLLVQSGSVYGRIGGAVGFFAGGFALLYMLHPAFRISSTPVIILIAYALGLLALFAFGVVLGKYTEVMKAWRERVGGVHASDISRAGALVVAFSLGLTNLAKRPLRTGVTVVSVSLLAFSAMTFTSVDTSLDTRFVPVSAVSPRTVDSLLLRLYKWAPIMPSMAENFERDLGPGGTVVLRSLKVKTRKPWDIGLGVNRFILTRPETGDSFTAEALQGFMSGEGRFSDLPPCVKGRWFSGRPDEVILPARAAAALGITEQDVATDDERRQPAVNYGNLRLRVVGILDTSRADALRDCSGEWLSPVDFYLSGMILTSGEKDVRNLVGSEANVSFLSFDRTVLLPHSLVMDLGGSIYTVAGRLGPSTGGGRKAIEGLMSRLEVNLFAAVEGQAYLVKTAKSQSVQGAWKILLPILLVILIMVNTMLGTVEERAEEIMMLGAVGLAPRHVTILFLAESCVYGVLGLVFGVMLGLGVSWVTRDWSMGVNVNYASVSTVMMGVFIVVVVVLATWIPAWRAARLATPSGAAKWHLPPDHDGSVCLTLPFKVTRDNGLGVFAFLSEYLNSHRESTSANFRCGDLSFGIVAVQDGSEVVRISGLVWLAPYDMQVSEDLTLTLSPMEDGDLFRIDVECRRVGGELDAWKRGTFAFLDLVRGQFLIYRALPEASKEVYLETACTLLA